jgi:hypothetical protein
MSVGAVHTDLPVAAAPATCRRALFLLDASPSFEQQLPMARVLDEAGWECWFMPLVGTRLADDAAKQVRVWPLIPGSPRGDVSAGGRASPKSNGPPPNRIRTALARTLRAPGMSAAHDLIFAIRMTKEWRKLRSLARARLAALTPRCIVTAQDRIQSALPVVAGARDLGIPIILAASAGLFMPDSCAYLRKDNPDVRLDPGPGTRWSRLMLNRLVALLQPEQVFPSRWGRMLYQSAGWHLAARLAGLALPSFWYQGARFADAVVISGDDERLVCERAGIPPAKVAAIGSSALQIQFERRRDCERIRGVLGVAGNEVMVVVAVPQFWEHGMMDPTTHFAFVDRLFALLGKCKAKVIASLHPKMHRSYYLFRAQAAGLRLAERPLIEVLPAADLFIAAAYSATVRWGMAMGIPCINLDLWHLNDSTYCNLAEYPTVRSWDAVEQWLDARIAEGRPKPSAGSLPMGLICDGRFGERFVALVERITKCRRASEA